MCRKSSLSKDEMGGSQDKSTTFQSRGLFLQLASVCLFSIMGVFLKLASKYDIPSSELVFMRAIFQGIFVVCSMCYFQAEGGAQGPVGKKLIFLPFGGSRYCIGVVLVRGIVGATGFCLAYYTMSVLEIGDAVATLSLYPIPTIILARFLLLERIGLLQTSSVILSVSGALLITQPSIIFGGNARSSNRLGYITGVLGSCTASGVVTLIRKAGLIGAHTLQLLFSWVLFGSVFSAFGAFWQEWKVPPDFTCWLYILCMAIFGSLAHFLLNYAGRLIPAGASSVIRSTNIIWAYIWEVAIFHVHPNITTWCGVALIGSSLFMVALQKIYSEQSDDGLSVDETLTVDDDNRDDLELATIGLDMAQKPRYSKVHVSDEDLAR